jgi:hypothetical protein
MGWISWNRDCIVGARVLGCEYGVGAKLLAMSVLKRRRAEVVM